MAEADRRSCLPFGSVARRYFRPAVAAAGLNPGLTFHGLRHTAVSILAAEGA
jgi:integrase